MKKVLLTIMLAGMALGATSCFDNLEPAGLEDMRGAKAELLRANAQLQLAEIKIKEAQALEMTAQAALAEAKAKEQQLMNQRYEAETAYIQRLQELEIARQEAADAAAKAAIENQIALEAELHKENMQKIADRMAEAAAQHEATMVTLQTAMANAEKEYQTALAQLKLAQATANSACQAQLSSMISQLQTCRQSIIYYTNELAKTNRNILKVMTYDIPTLERTLAKNLETAKKDSVLAHEKVAILTAARDKNEADFGPLVEKYQAKMDSLVKAWTTYDDVAYKQAKNKKDELTIAYAELQYMYDGDHTDYLSTLGNLMENKDLNPERSVTVTEIPADLVSYFNVYDPDCDADNRTATIKANSLKDLKTDLEALLTSLGGYAAAAGLTSSQIAEIEFRISQHETILEQKKDAYTTALDTYETLRDAYFDNTETYGYDWTGLLDDPQNHMYATTRKTLVTYYKKWADTGTPLTANELKAVAGIVSAYLTANVTITDNFFLDPPVEVYQAGAVEPVLWRRSRAIVQDNTTQSDLLYTAFMSYHSSTDYEGMVDRLIGSSESIAPRTSLSYPSIYGHTEEEVKALYTSSVVAMLDAAEDLYGFRGFSLGDIAETDLVVYDYPNDTPLLTGLSDMTFTNYLTRNSTYSDVLYGDFAVLSSQPYYRLNGGVWVSGSRNCTTGLLVEKELAQMVVNDLNWLIAKNDELADNKEECLDYIETFAETVAGIVTEAEAAEKAAADANDAMTAAQDTLDKYEYENRVDVDAAGNLNNPTNMSLAEMEYKLYKDIRDTYQGYLDLYNGLEDSEGNAIVVTSIKTDIENAITNAETKDAAVETARKNIAVWNEQKVDFATTPDTDAIDLIILNLENEAAMYQETIDNYQLLFDSLTAQKDAILALMQ